MPALGICLGMQYMGLAAGATLHQHLDEVLDDPEFHKGDHVHLVTGEIGSGRVTSWHHQALADAGTLVVVGRAEDGVIEAVSDPARRFWIGVQWHPERTDDPVLGRELVRSFVESARQC